MTSAAPPGSAAEALGMLKSAMGYLAAADVTAMATETQAQCLQILEQAHSMGTAARASILAAFTAGQGYSADADYSPRAWLIHKTGITKGAATAYRVGPRAAAHPQVAQALAAGKLSESVARTICGWTDKLPQDCREAADTILVAAARSGMDVRDLAGLAGEIYARSLPEDPGTRGRWMRRSRTARSSWRRRSRARGCCRGTCPECAAMVAAVLDALSAPAGAEDTRSQAQRYHDGLQQAMRRLVASGLLPERAGQPVKVWVHISFADLMLWTATRRCSRSGPPGPRAWAGHRAEASASGSDGGAWLDGDAAEAVACDAAMAPIVTGEVNLAALDDLVRLCVQLDRLATTARAGTARRRRRRTGTARMAAAAGTAAGCARPRTPPGRGRPSSRRSSVRPRT